MRAVADTLAAHGMPAGQISRAGLDWLLGECLKAGDTAKLRLPGLAPERQEVLPGGLAILVELFEHARHRDAARGRRRAARGPAVRPARPPDRRGRPRAQRARAGGALPRRCRAGRPRRGHCARASCARCRAGWKLDEPLAELVLRWSARLHEVGLDIAHAHYHRHGAYLLANADLPGFPREEQSLLAALVGNHRRKLNLEQIEELVPPWHLKAEYLIVLLRLAVLLHRARGPARAARDRPATEGALARGGVPEGLARGPSAHRGGSRAGSGLPARRRLPAARRLRPACAAGAVLSDWRRAAGRGCRPRASSCASATSACERNSAR